MRALKPEELYRKCDPDTLGFDTTDDVEPLDGIIGQDRAVRAMQLGLGIRQRNYNIYVAGSPGTGKHSTIRSYLEKASRDLPKPSDLCYVHNFQEPYKPRHLQLPAGRACALRGAMLRLVDQLRREVPIAFRSEEYQQKRRQIDRRATRLRKQLLEERLEKPAAEQGFVLQNTPIGVNVVPMRDGKPLTEESFLSLEPEERKAIEERQARVQQLTQEVMQEVAQLEERRAEQHDRLNRTSAHFVIQPRLDQLRRDYADLAPVRSYLDAVQSDLVDNVARLFLEDGEEAEDVAARRRAQERLFRRYRVNVLVDHTRTDGAPVVVVDNPSYTNLFGSVERRVESGVLTADFTGIRAGSLHQANGGFLVVSAEQLFHSSASWGALTSALKTSRVRLEDPSRQAAAATAESLRPEAVALDLKVILVGNDDLYHVLNDYEEDFRKLFHVKSDFDSSMELSVDNVRAFGRFVRARCDELSLLPFHKSGVARAVEFATRMTGDSDRLSTRFSDVSTLIVEASYWARDADADVVRAEHVERAIDERELREGLYEERVQRAMDRGEILVDVHGEAVGQVNGLAVHEIGDVAFGRPTRLTATAFAGKEGVVNLERECDLSGNIHTKGTLILKGWLGEKFANDKPLSLTSTLTFEQNYESIDGDSASSTELYALMSALASAPVRQGIAVTGSVDQKGQIQPIGGANEKIEGFFKVCAAKGLDGHQGVIIPHQNVHHLMLASEVVEAVRAGRFHVWAIETVEQGLELLTGLPAGTRGEDGFPPESLYGRADLRLIQMAELLESFKPPGEEDELDDEDAPELGPDGADDRREEGRAAAEPPSE